MTYRMTDIKVRSLLSLNQKPSLCIVTMILSVYFCAINWKVSLRVFLLRNFVCPTKCLITYFSMVQGYPEEDSSCSGFGCSLTGIRNAGKSFANSGIKARIGSSAFLSYWTSNPSGYPHEQWCSYQSEKFKLRRFEKLGGETGGLMLNITGLNRFFFCSWFSWYAL